MLLKASTRRRSSSTDRTAIRASKSPRAMRCVARVSRRTGSAMRSASDRPSAAPSRTKHSTARWTPRSRSSISRSMSRCRSAAGTVRIALPPAGANRRRRDQVRHRAELVFVDEARQPLQHDGAIDVVRRSRRQQARREEIALARRDQLRAVEDVDVLIDDLADPHHHVVVAALDAVGAAIQERVGLFDDALRHRRRARRFALNVLAQQIGEVGADDQRQDQHRDDRGEDERQEQLAVEAGANLAQQGAPDARPLAAEPGEDRGRQQHEHERRARERADLGQMHQVVEQREHAGSRWHRCARDRW